MAVEAEELQRDEGHRRGQGRGRRGRRPRAAAQEEEAQEAVGEEVEEAAHHEARRTPTCRVGGDAVTVAEGVTVGDFADALGVPANDVIKRLFMLGHAAHGEPAA